MPAILHKYVPADERVIFSARPSPLFIVIRSFWPIVAIVAAATVLQYAGTSLGLPGLAESALRLGTALVLLVLAWQLLQWLSRWYVLTEHRLLSIAGILLQNVADVPLRNVQNVV